MKTGRGERSGGLCCCQCLWFWEMCHTLVKTQPARPSSSSKERSDGQGACHILSYLNRTQEQRSLCHPQWTGWGICCLSSLGLPLYEIWGQKEHSSWLHCTIPGLSPVPSCLPLSEPWNMWLQSHLVCTLEYQFPSLRVWVISQGIFLNWRKGAGNHLAPPSPIKRPSLNLL